MIKEKKRTVYIFFGSSVGYILIHIHLATPIFRQHSKNFVSAAPLFYKILLKIMILYCNI